MTEVRRPLLIRPSLIRAGIAVLVGLLVLVCIDLALPGRIMINYRWKQYSRDAYSLHSVCFAYAQNHNGAFPTGQTANAAYRELFRAGLVDDERLLLIEGSAWCPAKSDGEIGTAADGFAKALSPGENGWAYVRGQDSAASSSESPLIVSAYWPIPGRVAPHPGARPSLIGRKYAVIVRVGGNAKLYEVDESLRLLDSKTDRWQDGLLSFDPALKAEDVLNPEPPPENP